MSVPNAARDSWADAVALMPLLLHSASQMLDPTASCVNVQDMTVCNNTQRHELAAVLVRMYDAATRATIDQPHARAYTAYTALLTLPCICLV